MAGKRGKARVRMDMLVPEITKRSIDEYSRYCGMSMTEYVVELVRRDGGRLARELGPAERLDEVMWYDVDGYENLMREALEVLANG